MKKKAPEELLKHSYKKGQSGNPAGKPKGALNRSTIAKKWLTALTKRKNPLTGKAMKMSFEDAITLGQLKKAIDENDTQAYKALMDSAHGLPKGAIEHSGDLGLSITVTKTYDGNPDKVK